MDSVRRGNRCRRKYRRAGQRELRRGPESADPDRDKSSRDFVYEGRLHAGGNRRGQQCPGFVDHHGIKERRGLDPCHLELYSDESERNQDGYLHFPVPTPRRRPRWLLRLRPDRHRRVRQNYYRQPHDQNRYYSAYSGSCLDPGLAHFLGLYRLRIGDGPECQRLRSRHGPIFAGRGDVDERHMDRHFRRRQYFGHVDRNPIRIGGRLSYDQSAGDGCRRERIQSGLRYLRSRSQPA